MSLAAIDPQKIILPPDLRPIDGRFGSGPAKVRTEAVDRLAATGSTFLGTSHRRDTVRTVVGQIRSGLTDLFSLPDGYEVILGNGGATAFWDAAAFGLIEQRSEHAVLGEFSSKFAALVTAVPHLAEPLIVTAEPGARPEMIADSSIDAYALPHNETSTGVALDIKRIGDGLMLIDATSAAGGLRVDPQQFDAYYFSPQKAFGSEGGLWLACVAPAAIERIERLAASDRWIPPSLDLGIALDNSRLDQTYNTPSLATLFLLADTVEWMNANGGLEWAATRCDNSAATIYDWAEAHEMATPFVADAAARSRVTATIDFDGVDAEMIAAALRANGILDTEPYRKLGRNQLRVALFPIIEPDDVATLTRAIDFIIAVLPE